MGTDRAALGARGERLAAQHLESLGYKVVERNYRCPYGEIDIVASEGGDLVFVEVKTRRNQSFGCPSEGVDFRKQQKLVLSGEHYLMEREIGEVNCRFDVAEVYFLDGRPVTIEIIKGAFSADWSEAHREL